MGIEKMKMTNEEKLLELFSSTIESNNFKYNGPIDKIDYYSLMCRAATNNSLISLLNSNVCMFNYNLQEKPSVLILFAIPIVLEEKEKTKVKHITERIMEVVELMEKCFVTLDAMNSEEVKTEKFVYLTSVKKVIEEECEC